MGDGAVPSVLEKSCEGERRGAGLCAGMTGIVAWLGQKTVWRRRLWWWVIALASGGSHALGAFEWKTATPESQGVDSEGLARMFAEYNRDRPAIRSFLLVRNGKIVTEAYMYPQTPTTLHQMYSVSKSFTSALIGIAIERGHFSGVDEKVVDIFSGVTVTKPADANLGKMRLRHLLTMSTGHSNDTMTSVTGSANWERAFLELPVQHSPGSTFVYNSGASYMLAAAIERRSGMRTEEFAKKYLFGPLGITDYSWSTSPQGIPAGGWGLLLKPRDMARFGLLYLNNGKWDGRQIVPASWVKASSRNWISTGNPNPFWGRGYGYQFWMNDFGGYRADGAFAQYIFILPAYNAVAVFNSALSDSELPARLMRTHVLPAMRSAKPLTPNPRGVALLKAYTKAAGAAPTTGNTAPLFTAIPTDWAFVAGETLTLTTNAEAKPSPKFQWYRNNIAIKGETSRSLSIRNGTAKHEGDYVLRAKNSAGTTLTYPIRLAMISAPRIVRAPTAVAAATGGEAVFRVEAAGGSLNYQWHRNGVALRGKTDATLHLKKLKAAHAGNYTVTVSNTRGQVTTAKAKLTVKSADKSARLVAFSARSYAATSAKALRFNLDVRGDKKGAALPVLLRASKVKGRETIGDPMLRLYAGGKLRSSNNDWQGDSVLADTAKKVGGTSLSAAGLDAAMREGLAPGPYTVLVSPAYGAGAGTSFAEVFDATLKPSASTPKLGQVAARAYIGSGDAAMVGHVRIAGKGKVRLLIRGVGPSVGASPKLKDPTLRVYTGKKLVAKNDNWAGKASLKRAFKDAGASTLSSKSKDAALVVELGAGDHLVQLAGKGSAKGLARLEVYLLP